MAKFVEAKQRARPFLGVVTAATVTDGEVSDYAGYRYCWGPDPDSYPFKLPHSFDSGSMSGDPGYIRLFPYADSTNSGGVCVLAVCSLGGDGYPVRPEDCAYDVFKVMQVMPE